MSGEALRWLLGIVVIAHGVGHVLFMPALHEVLRLQNDGRSWLVTPVLGDGITSMLASIAAGITAIAALRNRPTIGKKAISISTTRTS